jgi:hypothetical protein
LSQRSTFSQATLRPLSVLHAAEGEEVGGAELAVPAATDQAVDCDDVVPAGRQVESGGPAQVAVGSEDEDKHRHTP